MGRTEVWGTDPPKCGAKTRNRDHQPCQLTAGFGTPHLGVGKCKFHGGTSPAHMRNATKQIVFNRMRAAYGDLVDTNPSEALLTEVKRAAGVVEWIGAIVADFTKMNLDDVSQKEARKAALMQNAFDGWQAAAWVDLYFKERRHLAAVAKMALDAGVAERQVQLEEEKVALVASVMQRVFDDLNPTAEQRAAFPGLVRTHLALLAGPAAS